MFIRFPLLDTPDLVHAVTTRLGGVSQPPHDTLNLSWSRPDAAAAVLENRRRLCRALEIPLEHVVQAGQIHGVGVRAITAAERGAGAFSRTTLLPAADALITNVPDVYLLACFADCTPLLCFDPVRRAVGVAHAGWRGTVAHMGAALLAGLTAHYGSDPADVRIVIGPAAGPCCYAVGHEVVTAASAAFPERPELLHERQGQIFFDLWAANRHSLLSAGAQPEHIAISGHCTIHQAEQFFSHRATSGLTGRFAAVIGLRS